MAIDRDGRKRLLLGHHVVQCTADLCKLRRAEIGLPPDRRKTRGHQQCIVLTQGDIERRGEPDHHVTTGRRSPHFKEAEVALGDAGTTGKIQLRPSSAMAPPF
jgi:hypothetical protein